MTSLAAAHSQNDSAIVLAGINSSLAEQKRDNNQHLRSFKIDYPPSESGSSEANEPEKTTTTDQDGSASKDKPIVQKNAPLSQTSLFRTKGGESGADTYQRVLTLSPWRNPDTHRVAVISTGLAPSGEIVFFNVSAGPCQSDVIGRIRLGSGEEAEDVDITDLEDGKFGAAYSNGSDVFTCQVSSEKKTNGSPEVDCVYSQPLPAKGKGKPKFRTLRFLSPTTLLLLQNAPDRGGCELVLLRLPTSGDQKATVLQRRRLHKTMKIGLGLDVCNLGTNPENQQQSIIAVSGSDLSIEVLTIEYDPRRGYGKLAPYTTFREVHPFSMTKICFSTFIPPPHPVTPDVPPQTVKLASVSMGNTVVVHTFHLSPFPPPSTTPRYVLSNPGRSYTMDTIHFSLAALASLLLTLFLLQAFSEIRGLAPPHLGAVNWLPPQIREAVAVPYTYEPPHRAYYVDDQLQPPLPSSSSSPPSPTPIQPLAPKPTDQSLRSLLRSRLDAGTLATTADAGSAPPSIIVRCEGEGHDILVETADSASLEIRDMTPWEELGEEQRAKWIQRLIESGHWAVEESEGILTGVLFSGYAGLVRDRVRSSLV